MDRPNNSTRETSIITVKKCNLRYVGELGSGLYANVKKYEYVNEQQSINKRSAFAEQPFNDLILTIPTVTTKLKRMETSNSMDISTIKSVSSSYEEDTADESRSRSSTPRNNDPSFVAVKECEYHDNGVCFSVLRELHALHLLRDHPNIIELIGTEIHISTQGIKGVFILDCYETDLANYIKKNSLEV